MSDEAYEFDHFIHWIDDLGAAMAAYDDYGLPTHASVTVPGFRNAAWGVDDARYVELATVDDWQAVATSPFAAGLRALKPTVDALSGPGPLTFAVNVPDARATAEQLRNAGHTIDEVDIHLAGQEVGFVEVFVRDAPPYWPFFITYDPPREEIARIRAEYRADHDISHDGQPDLVALLVSSTQPEADARGLAELLDCRVNGSTVALPGADVRFESGDAARLTGIAVRGSGLDPGDTQIAGMTVRAEPAD